jgi:hypothetical protein
VRERENENVRSREHGDGKEVINGQSFSPSILQSFNPLVDFSINKYGINIAPKVKRRKEKSSAFIFYTFVGLEIIKNRQDQSNFFIILSLIYSR